MLSSMSLFVTIVWFCQLTASSSIIHTVSSEATTHKLTKRARLILQSYTKFQISDGISGDCASSAETVFLRPYGLTQATLAAPNPIRVPIDQTDLQVCNQMARLAVDAESSFTQAINKVGGTNTVIGKELQNGKVCNKVLKQTGQVLCLQVSLVWFYISQYSFNSVIKISDISQDLVAKGQKQRSFLGL
ncbi:hypothetical protein VP01_1833g4 [Puccinia sorghi]|uniref:Uncharacterized protein n=1 Tax=Puccinia sorghi TaxID=27349 RepID=A0A0L6VFP9_9BASI|nr:hypothetical protein VP01_1833g4 [Puccinia sorghi]